MKETTLYIIGNGFDLAHNQATSYVDFYSYCKDIEDYYDDLFRTINSVNMLHRQVKPCFVCRHPSARKYVHIPVCAHIQASSGKNRLP
jgi:hypothetical protein